jgi:hypothetical protein
MGIFFERVVPSVTSVESALRDAYAAPLDPKADESAGKMMAKLHETAAAGSFKTGRFIAALAVSR